MYTSDPVERHRNTVHMDSSKWQSIHTSNRYQVLETLQEDNVGTFGNDSETEFQMHDDRVVGMDDPSLILNPDRQLSNSAGKAVAGMFQQKVVIGPDPVSDSGDNSDTNFSPVQEFQKCEGQIGAKFGCISLTPIYVHKGPPKVWNQIPDVLIKNTGIPNFGGLPIPVQTNFEC